MYIIDFFNHTVASDEYMTENEIVYKWLSARSKWFDEYFKGKHYKFDNLYVVKFHFVNQKYNKNVGGGIFVKFGLTGYDSHGHGSFTLYAGGLLQYFTVDEEPSSFSM